MVFRVDDRVGDEVHAVRLCGLALERVQANGAVVTVEGAVMEGVQALAFVLLAADRTALGLVGEVAEHEPGLDEPAVLLQRPGQRQLAAGGLQPGDEQARGDGAVAQRCAAAHEVVPGVADDGALMAPGPDRSWRGHGWASGPSFVRGSVSSGTSGGS